MSDVAAANKPVDPVPPDTQPASPPPEAAPTAASDLTPEAKAQADQLFAELEPQSEFEAWKYMAARVPQQFQAYFVETHPCPT